MDELLKEIVREIAAQPVQFTVQAVQSLLLIGILAWAGRKYSAGRLAARRARIAAELADADAAEQESVRLRAEVPTVASQSKEAAAGIVRSAREKADAERAASAAAIEAEARQIVDQARSAVEAEKAAVHREASERLMSLTTEAAKRYLDEMLTETERRALTQKAILDFLNQVETSAGTGGAG